MSYTCWIISNYVSTRFLLLLSACTTDWFFSWALKMYKFFILFIKQKSKTLALLGTSLGMITFLGVTILKTALIGIENTDTEDAGTKTTGTEGICFGGACTGTTSIKGACNESFCAPVTCIKGACLESASTRDTCIRGTCTRSACIKGIFVGTTCTKSTCIGGASTVKHSGMHSQAF